MLLRACAIGAGVFAASAISSCAFVTNGIGGAGGAMSSSTAASTTASSSSHASTSSGTGGGAAQPTCADGIKNGMETDVDCGGDACPPCALGKHCKDNADCMSGTCSSGVCAPTSTMCEPVMPGSPSCHDCIKDGMETDVDCGGDACPPCALGKACVVDADCTTGSCRVGVCAANAPGCQPVDPNNPSCADCVKDGAETDIDCGGDACPPCAIGKACVVPTDCASGSCQLSTCVASTPGCQPVDPSNPTCDDCVKDGTETDVDCGGDACLPCGAGKGCGSGADCMSGVCAAGECHTGSKGAACVRATDCASGVCSPGMCWTGLCCG